MEASSQLSAFTPTQEYKESQSQYLNWAQLISFYRSEGYLLQENTVIFGKKPSYKNLDEGEQYIQITEHKKFDKIIFKITKVATQDSEYGVVKLISEKVRIKIDGELIKSQSIIENGHVIDISWGDSEEAEKSSMRFLFTLTGETLNSFTANYEIIGTLGMGKYSVVTKGINKNTRNLVSIKQIERKQPIAQSEFAILKFIASSFTSSNTCDVATQSLSPDPWDFTQLSDDKEDYHQYNNNNNNNNTNYDTKVEYESSHHPSIIHFIEGHELDSFIFLIFEYFEGKDLFIFDPKYKFKEEEVQIIIYKIIFGLEYLHSLNIIHRDIKPENILFDKNEDGRIEVKIIDFGLAVRSPGKGIAGTKYYMAPEVSGSNNNNQSYGVEADMWSVGVLCFWLLTNRNFPLTFDNINHSDDDDDDDDDEEICLADKINVNNNKNNHREDRWNRIQDKMESDIKASIAEKCSNTSPLARSFLKSLLTVDRNQRSTAKQALDHPWLKDCCSPPSSPPLSPSPPIVSSPELLKRSQSFHSPKPPKINSSPIIPSPPPSQSISLSPFSEEENEIMENHTPIKRKLNHSPTTFKSPSPKKKPLLSETP